MRFRLLCIAVVCLLACSALADDLNVAAAADLSFAVKDLAADFQSRTGHVVRVSLGSSGNFYAQIQSGAPFDVFLSADVSYPQQLEREGRVQAGSVIVYATGRIVVWAPKTAKFDVTAQGMNALLDPSVQQIAIANPRHAPYGRAAEAAIRHAGLYDQVARYFVFGENIAQTAHFVETGNADIGIIALSIALSPEMNGQGKYWTVPDDWYPPLQQGAAVVKATRHPEAARAFLEYLKSPAATAILQHYGFAVPNAAAPTGASTPGPHKLQRGHK